jgi:hypothetical protein
MKERSMTSKTSVAGLVLAAGLGLGAARAAAQEVTVQSDKQADFSRCTTYAWAEGQPAENPLADKNIVAAIDQALAARGWRKVESGAACLVRYQASVREEKSLQVWDSPRPFVRGIASVDIKTVVNGMLVVDIADAAKREFIWRAVARDTVSDKPEKNEKKLAKAVAKMFAQFPPAGGR